MNTPTHRPQMTAASLEPARTVVAVDEYGEQRTSHIAAEQPLTLYVDKREIVTLMTLGLNPELLVLGFLKNQGFVQSLAEIKSVQVDWDSDAVAVTTFAGIEGWEEKLARRTVTTGCGQGTVFGRIMDEIDQLSIAPLRLRQSSIYALLKNLNAFNDVYKRAGAVHGCALCDGELIEFFTEDVGRHNAVDAIAGYMWLENIDGSGKIFYTTGRLTSEMVIKVAQMGIPALLSRSGITQKGLELAERIGITMIARAKGRHFMIYNGAESIELDARPSKSGSNNDDSTRRS